MNSKSFSRSKCFKAMYFSLENLKVIVFLHMFPTVSWLLCKFVRWPVSVRTYRWYRRPKRIHHELRPEPPPFLGKGTQLQKQLDIMFNASEETKKSLVEGLDFPLMTRPMRPKLISCSDQVFQPYKPPEDKSKLTASVTSPARLFSPADSVALRRMRKSMGDFEKRKFLEISHEVYTNLIETMNRVPIRVESVMEYCTEHCYPVLMEGLQGTQITWKYLETVEPSRIVRARIGSFVQVQVFSLSPILFNTEKRVGSF